MGVKDIQGRLGVQVFGFMGRLPDGANCTPPHVTMRRDDGKLRDNEGCVILELRYQLCSLR